MYDMDVLSMLFDTLLIVAVLGLWFAWVKQNQQQSMIENKLAEAASQLQEATQLLDQALQQIGALQGMETVEISTQGKTKSARMDETSSAGDDAQLAQILRMQREGESAEIIAQKLDIPLAQVKLLLMISSPESGQ